METLNCDFNQLTTLPELPNSLIELRCIVNQLTSLPELPNSLETLDCDQNQLTSLPELPNSLETLYCEQNQLTSLPELPNALHFLNCRENLLTALPELPNSLHYLYCSHNQITALPELPNSLSNLYCIYNQITILPELPEVMYSLNVDDNPYLNCLPELTQIVLLSFQNTNIQCLPNFGNVSTSSPLLSDFPLCDVFNINGCDFYYNISGQVYDDQNANCMNDSGEDKFSNIKINLFQDGSLLQQVISNVDGNYSFDTDLGEFEYTVDTLDLPYLVACPGTGFYTSILTSIDSVDTNMDFGIECKPGFDVGVHAIIQQEGQFFPANEALLVIQAGDLSQFYNLNCASGVSGDISIEISGPAEFVGLPAGSLSPVVSGNTLNYSIADYGFLDLFSDIQFYLQTDTFAQIGDQICIDVSVSPTAGDNEVSNNNYSQCFDVVNSYDPNDKNVFPSGEISPDTQWLQYRIRFQNTGNAPAQNIVIVDTLEENLQIPSFSFLGASHDAYVNLEENVLKFTFPNINLPDSISDEANSHGYALFKIKIQGDLPLGTVIENTAGIYFDFNPPIITNTTENIIAEPSGIDEVESPHITIFPNPTADLAYLEAGNLRGNYTMEIYNVDGKLIQSNQLQLTGNPIPIKTDFLSKGIYLLRIADSSHSIGAKFVRE